MEAAGRGGGSWRHWLQLGGVGDIAQEKAAPRASEESLHLEDKHDGECKRWAGESRRKTRRS